WLDTDTVEVSRLVPTCDIGSADAVTCCAAGEDWLSTPTNTPTPSTAAAAAEAAQVATRVRRRRQRTVASNVGNNSGDILGSTVVPDPDAGAAPNSSIAATSSRSRSDRSAGTPLSSPTA